MATGPTDTRLGVLLSFAGIVLAGAMLVIAAILATTSVAAAPRCTHGVSSVGPVTLVNGKVVEADTTPATEACLP